MKMALALACLLAVGTVQAADCVANARGKTVCAKNGQAVVVNPNTGTAAKAEKSDAGVTTVQSAKGGEAKTKNGKGVYQSPSGKTCVKTANNQGCS
ncbi:MAG: hypothetical protein H7Z19_10805 [Chitinophagaceae bacterium]|nr:hypothetical protein [Rubrivivax sp.]